MNSKVGRNVGLRECGRKKTSQAGGVEHDKELYHGNAWSVQLFLLIGPVEVRLQQSCRL